MSNDTTLCTLAASLAMRNVENEFNSVINTVSDTTSDSEDDEEEDIVSVNIELELMYAILMTNETRGEVVHNEKIEDYVERVVPGYSRAVFKEHFR